MMRRYLPLPVLLLLSLLLAPLLGAPPASAAGSYQTGSDMDKLRALSGKAFETMFLSMMIQHHQGAVDMAHLVPDHSRHAELKTLAQSITSSQTREIGEMTTWLDQWYQQKPQPGMMNMSGMMDMGKLTALQGDAFDREFLTEMRVHHMSAVAMAHLVPDRATHQELKDLAQAIISSQTSEIKDMGNWLQTWYGVNPTAPGDMGNMGGMGNTGTPSPAGNTGNTPATGTTGALPATGHPGDGLGWLLLALALGIVGAGSSLRIQSHRPR